MSDKFDFLEAARRALGGASIRRAGWVKTLRVRYSNDFLRWQSCYKDETWENDMGNTLSPIEMLGTDWEEYDEYKEE